MKNDVVNTDHLRLEVEVPTDGLPNLIQNPSGELGTWGWETPVANTTLIDARDLIPRYEGLRFETAVSQACHFTSEFLPVAAGKYVSSRLRVISGHTQHSIRIRYQWFNAAKTLISTSVQSGALSSTGVKYGPTAIAPASTAFAKVRIDFYSGTGTANPSSATSVTFGEAMVTWSDTGTPTTQRLNLIPNPSFEVSTTGWVASSGAVSRVAGGSFGSWSGQLAPSGTSIGTLRSAAMAVTGGKTYVLSAYLHHTAAGGTWGMDVEWRDGAGNPIGMTFLSANPGATTPTRRHITRTAPSNAATAVVLISARYQPLRVDGAMLEEGITLGDYFDGSTTPVTGVVYAWTGTAHNSASSRITTGATFAFAEPHDWHDILGPTHEIKINRQTLDVGTMSATVLDAQLDPAVVDVIQPGKRIRLRALLGDTWESVYTGRLSAARTDYAKAKGGSLSDPGAVRIDLTAVDNISHLANQGEISGVATIAELPYLLEGKGAPWSVNGSGNQITSAQIVFTNDNASVLDQVSIARDTELGYAWVDRNNVLQVWNANQIDNDPAVEFTDETNPEALSYSDIDVSYSTEDVINEVTVNFLRYAPVAGTTEEIPYGPWRDQVSIDTWGARSATFTVGGLTEDPVAMQWYAWAILTANATPKVRCNSLVMPVRNTVE